MIKILILLLGLIINVKCYKNKIGINIYNITTDSHKKVNYNMAMQIIKMPSKNNNNANKIRRIRNSTKKKTYNTDMIY